jgi:hypothetical protein
MMGVKPREVITTIAPTNPPVNTIMTANKTRANRENALRSSGPRSVAGKLKACRNAIVHGLYTAAVAPSAGESVEEFAELCAAVRSELRPEGVIEERVADRIALIL